MISGMPEEIPSLSLREKYRHCVPDRKNMSRISCISTIRILIDFSEAGTVLADQDLSITHRRRVELSFGSVCAADALKQCSEWRFRTSCGQGEGRAARRPGPFPRMFISTAHTVTLGPSGGSSSTLQAGGEDWIWKADAKSCTGAFRTADRRDEGLGLVWWCWTRATPEPARERSVIPSSTGVRVSRWSLFVSNGWSYRVSGKTQDVSPVSALCFSGKEIRLRGPLGAMGHSAGDLITMGQGPLLFIDADWK